MQQWNEGGKEAFVWYLHSIAQTQEFLSYDFEREKMITRVQMQQTLMSHEAVGWYVEVLDRGYFEYVNDDGNKEQLEIKVNETDLYDSQIIYEDYLTYCKQAGHRHPGIKNKLSAKLNNMKISFSNEKSRPYITDDEGKLRKLTVWEFGSLKVLRNEWEQRYGDYRWSSQEQIAQDEDTNMMKFLQEEKKETRAEKTKKIVGKLGDLEWK